MGKEAEVPAEINTGPKRDRREGDRDFPGGPVAKTLFPNATAF